jgi:hypothetical protein
MEIHGKAHQEVEASRHLHSSLHLFVPFFKDLPWRTFTLSLPLQEGIWLLRRLRPLFRPLAFSRLLQALAV